MSWQKISSVEKYKNRFMTITEDEVITDNGDKILYGIVHKEPFAIAIPWDGTRTVLVGQYRYAIDTFSWEFPMGHYETTHASVEDAAKKELHEETGIEAEHIKEIGNFYLGAGHHTQKGYIFLATGLKIGDRELEPSEIGMQMKWVTLEELSNLIQNGEIKDGPTITAFKFLEFYFAKQ